MIWRGLFGSGGGDPDNIRYRRLRYVFFGFPDSDMVAPVIIQVLPIAVVPHRGLRISVPGQVLSLAYRGPTV